MASKKRKYSAAEARQMIMDEDDLQMESSGESEPDLSDVDPDYD